MLNVDEPISERWQSLLIEHGYRVADAVPVRTRRYRGLANADKRADHEVVIVAVRETLTAARGLGEKKRCSCRESSLVAIRTAYSRRLSHARRAARKPCGTKGLGSQKPLRPFLLEARSLLADRPWLPSVTATPSVTPYGTDGFRWRHRHVLIWTHPSTDRGDTSANEKDWVAPNDSERGYRRATVRGHEPDRRLWTGFE